MITDGEWNNATDPFVLALAASWGAFNVNTPGALPHSIDVLAKGPINGVWDDPDVQEVYLQKDTDPTLRVHATCSRVSSTTLVTAAAAGYDIGSEYRVSGGASERWEVVDKLTAVDVATDKLYAYFDHAFHGTPPPPYVPGDLARLFCKTGYVWREKDPAQILTSMLIHYSNDTLARDWLNKASVQAASAYYDSAPLRMSCMRKVGQSLLDQVVALFDQSSDMLCVRPADSDGKLQLHVCLRRELVDRPTVIDLDDPAWGVFEYDLQPTDEHTIERLEVEWGDFVKRGPNDGNPSHYETGFPMKLGNGQDREVQYTYTLANPKRVAVDAPNVNHRADVLRHLDIGYWREDQQEITLRMGPRHLNFECGDVIHLVGERLSGVVSTDSWLVVEKDENLDDMTAQCQLLRLRHVAGKLASQLGSALFEFSEQTLQPWQRRPDGAYFAVARDDYPRPGDRWQDQGSSRHHASQMTRGAGGPAGANPAPPQVRENVAASWPGVFFGTQLTRERWLDLSTRGGLREIDQINEPAQEYVFFFVLRVDPALALPSQYLFHCDFLALMYADGAKKLAFNDASGSGDQSSTADAPTGTFVVTFVLREGANAAKIRVNGADFQTGLDYVKAVTSSLSTLGGHSAGTLYGFGGYMLRACAIIGDPGDADIAAHEAFLMDRYGVT